MRKKTGIKYLEKVAIVLIVLWFISVVPNPLLNILVARLYGPQYAKHLGVAFDAVLGIRMLTSAVLQIGVAVWLFTLARRHGNSHWVWGVFGLVFSVSAAILYFLMRISDRLDLKDETKGNG